MAILNGALFSHIFCKHLYLQKKLKAACELQRNPRAFATCEDSIGTLSDSESSHQYKLHLGHRGKTGVNRLQNPGISWNLARPALESRESLGRWQHWKQQHQIPSKTDPCSLSSPVRTFITLPRYLSRVRAGDIKKSRSCWNNKNKHMRCMAVWLDSRNQGVQNMPRSAAKGRLMQQARLLWPGFRWRNPWDSTWVQLGPWTKQNARICLSYPGEHNDITVWLPRAAAKWFLPLAPLARLPCFLCLPPIPRQSGSSGVEWSRVGRVADFNWFSYQGKWGRVGRVGEWQISINLLVQGK